VLDVGAFGSDVEPYLYTSHGESAEYLALSYCWGGHLPLLLTKAKHNEFTHQLALANLPPMFRDAVLLTRLMGVRYLWIDALCIVQDDAADWAAEAARMYDIYAGALFTIAATVQPNPTAGLFARGATNMKQVTLHTKDDSPFVAKHDRFFVRRTDTLAFLWTFNGAPTTSRAWIFQERVSSRAVLHFLRNLGTT
jgi:hypothetical protein